MQKPNQAKNLEMCKLPINYMNNSSTKIKNEQKILKIERGMKKTKYKS